MISTVRRALARILAACSIAALLIPAASAGEFRWYQYESKLSTDGYDIVAYHTPRDNHDDEWDDCDEWEDCDDYGDCEDYEDCDDYDY